MGSLQIKQGKNANSFLLYSSNYEKTLGILLAVHKPSIYFSVVIHYILKVILKQIRELER